MDHIQTRSTGRRRRRQVAAAGAAGGCGLSVVGFFALVAIVASSLSAPSCQFNLGLNGLSGLGYEDCSSGIFKAAADGDLTATEHALLEAPPGTVNSDGRSPLFCTTTGSGPASGRLAVARLLLDRGADPNRANAAGDTPLLWAADRGEVELLHLLLDAGADPNLANHQQQTPLLRATYRKQDTAAVALLDAGADPDLAGSVDPMTEYLLLTGAAAQGVPPGTMPVPAAGAAPTAFAVPPPSVHAGYPPLVVAASTGDEVVVAALLQHDATVNVVAGPGITPLYAAAQQGDEHIVGVLLLAGADPTFGVPPGGITPGAVAHLGHHDAAAHLIDQAEQAKRANGATTTAR